MMLPNEHPAITLHLHPSFTEEPTDRVTVFQGVRSVTATEVAQQFYHVNALLPNFATGEAARLIRTTTIVARYSTQLPAAYH